jgi:hypothetical protein
VPTACRLSTEPGGQIIEGLSLVQTIEKGRQLFISLDDNDSAGGEILLPDLQRRSQPFQFPLRIEIVTAHRFPLPGCRNQDDRFRRLRSN